MCRRARTARYTARRKYCARRICRGLRGHSIWFVVSDGKGGLRNPLKILPSAEVGFDGVVSPTGGVRYLSRGRVNQKSLDFDGYLEGKFVLYKIFAPSMGAKVLVAAFREVRFLRRYRALYGFVVERPAGFHVGGFDACKNLPRDDFRRQEPAYPRTERRLCAHRGNACICDKRPACRVCCGNFVFLRSRPSECAGAFSRSRRSRCCFYMCARAAEGRRQCGRLEWWRFVWLASLLGRGAKPIDSLVLAAIISLAIFPSDIPTPDFPSRTALRHRYSSIRFRSLNFFLRDLRRGLYTADSLPRYTLNPRRRLFDFAVGGVCISFGCAVAAFRLRRIISDTLL